MHNPFTSGRGLVARFAQYAGFRPKAAKGKGKKAADDDDEKKKDDADAESDSPEHGDTGDDPSDDHMESDDDDEEMADDDDDEKMSDDPADDDDEPPKKKTKKKGKRAAGDDDEERAEDDEDKKEARRSRVHRARVHAFKEGRRAERARWTKILSSAHAAANLDTALRLAANTSLPSADVISELRKVGASTASEARRTGNPRIGTDTRGDSHLPPAQQAHAAIQASWAKAFAPTIEAGRAAH